MIHLLSSLACAARSPAFLAVLSVAMPLSAVAQQQSAPDVQSAAIEWTPALPVRLHVGDATRGLLTAQREGELASTTPRPLAGDVASLSYKRYLDSFKHPIPEKFGTTVKSSSGSGGASR